MNLKSHRNPISSSAIFILFFFLATVILHGCVLMPGHGFSEIERERSLGDNLGFEHVRNELPVNWFFKTERVINNMSKSGGVVDFDMRIDTSDFKEGTQSIRYEIRKCNSVKENMRLYAYYPGFFNEFDGMPGYTYRVSFWVKNNGCAFAISTRAVREHGGNFCESQSISSGEYIPEWKQFSLEQTICSDMRYLRFELDLKSPGVFQIDGLRIERVK